MEVGLGQMFSNDRGMGQCRSIGRERVIEGGREKSEIGEKGKRVLESFLRWTVVMMEKKGFGKRFFKSPAKVFLVTATGIALVAASNPNLIPSPYDSPFSSIRAPFHAIFRSSRAPRTIASNVIDYKYSLYGVPPDSDEYFHQLSMVHLRSARRILKLCEGNKGFYVKAGQFVASLRNVPKEYSSTLSSLQDQAVPSHFKAIKEVLVSNLGKSLSELFLSFDEQPIAAASIAQVHRAVLKDYQEVAIKYPGLENQMKIDIATMAILSKFVAWIFPEYRFECIVSEFKKAISLELDFIQEAKNSERTAWNFKNNNILRVPRIFWDLTTSQVLTMQFCRGQKINDVESLKKSGINPTKVAKALMEIFAEMIFVHGFVHGDPHPGNILVSPEVHQDFSIVLLDHGIYKELEEGFRIKYCQLWKALILRDSHKIQNLGEQFGVAKYSRYLPVIFTGRTLDSKSTLGRGMSDDENRKLKLELSSLRMGDFSSFMESLPPDFFTILRTDGLLRSIVSKLGAPHRVRLLAYAKYAIYGLATKSNVDSGTFVKRTIYRFRSRVSYFQLRALLEVLELLSLMEAFGHVFVKKLKRFLSKVMGFLVEISSP